MLRPGPGHEATIASALVFTRSLFGVARARGEVAAGRTQLVSGRPRTDRTTVAGRGRVEVKRMSA